MAIRWQTSSDCDKNRDHVFSKNRKTPPWRYHDSNAVFNVPDSELTKVGAEHKSRGGISENPKICGGAPCISGTRIPVWVLAQCWNVGMSDQKILEEYPSLKESDLNAAKRYIKKHKSEIDRQIDENSG
jgi:uncharacterized protein (DUF433 family)